ncbi:hypothetical protein CHS0354_025522 [Potamilus streckersoni]|uniref:Essential for reactive oxygen species protein n=1 Tax=Potamilus streckersoni TaxID=2493646 RepID=A0AAE0SKB3_9BIVA|nr:hypothetical protein CHS0354_025522 [Potamilus streckersoni]
MVCMAVEIYTEDRLYFSKPPNLKSWAMIAGFISFGYTVLFSGEESITWKVLFIITGIFIGIFWIDDWEKCDFNKSKGQISLKRYSAWDVFLYPFIGNRNDVIAKIEDVSEVKVKREDCLFWGMTYQIVLQFKTGMSLPITKSFTFGLSNEHEEIAQKIRSFLAQDSTIGGEVSSQDDAHMGDTSSIEESEDDFEIIEDYD